jgi:hypothetical protein
MGWLDNLWRRRQGRPTSSEGDMVQAHKRQQEEDGEAEADVLEEDAHRFRDEEVFREARKPPGTG